MFLQECTSNSVSTPSKVDVDKVRKSPEQEWMPVDNVLHMLSLLDIDDQAEFLALLRTNVRERVFLGANAGQHRAKIRHEFLDFETKLKIDKDLKDHYLQTEVKKEGIDPLNLPRYSASSWLHTTSAMIAVGLPPGVSS